MDDDTRDLIAQLFTRIGMTMEDASTVALLAGNGDHAALEVAVAEIGQAAEKISALFSTIRAVLGE